MCIYENEWLSIEWLNDILIGYTPCTKKRENIHVVKNKLFTVGILEHEPEEWMFFLHDALFPTITNGTSVTNLFILWPRIRGRGILLGKERYPHSFPVAGVWQPRTGWGLKYFHC